MATSANSRPLLLMGRAISAAAQFQELIRENSGRELWFSYGDHIPSLPDGFLFWGAGRYAYSLRETLPGRSFMAPGPRWLSGLPEEFLGRRLVTEAFESSVNAVGELPSVRFKLAETKHDRLPASRYQPGELRRILAELPELASAQVQWTEAELSLDWEHRFFVLDGEILTGTPYLVGGRVYSPSTSWARYEEALAFASFAARELQPVSPPSYTLDVALDLTTERWLIVEANRSWSSGLYGADVDSVLTGVEASLEPSDWEWRPDPALASYGKAMEVLEPDRESSGVLRLN